MKTLDASIESARTRPRDLVPLLLERARIRSRLEDFQDALATTATFVETTPGDPLAWSLRVQALTITHQFAEARELLPRIADADTRADLALALGQASGSLALDDVIAQRAARATQHREASTLTLYAVTLAEAGRYDEAVALIPRAAAALRSNTAGYLAWLLFEWGRIHELRGALATARDCFAEAHRRLPAYVEATAHLIATLFQTGDRDGARALAASAAAADPHPELRALAYGHAATKDPAEAQAIARAWRRYTDALPLAFAAHAARALLALGTDPRGALALAEQDVANRPTAEAKELVLEAALAIHDDPQLACDRAAPFVTAGSQRQQFLAWQALSACGRSDDADALARRLRIGAPAGAPRN